MPAYQLVPSAAESLRPPRLPERLFLASTHQEVLAALTRGLAGSISLISVTGEAGTGKTTLVRAGLDANGVSAVWFNGRGLGGAALDALCRAASPGASAAPGGGSGQVIVVDDAQELPLGILEELSSVRDRGREAGDGVPKLILIGRPELWPRLRGPNLSDRSGRAELRTVLFPMSYPDAERYVGHVLRRAGTATGKIMSPKALHEILLRSKGNPRRINAELERLLVTRIRTTPRNREAQFSPHQPAHGELLAWRPSAWEAVLTAFTRPIPTVNATAGALLTPRVAETVPDGENRRDADPSSRRGAKRRRWRRKLIKALRSRLTLVISVAVAMLAALVAVLPSPKDPHSAATMLSQSSPRSQDTRAALARAPHGSLGAGAADREAKPCDGGWPCIAATHPSRAAAADSRGPGSPW